MKITFLGTSAATSLSLPFCRCEVCVKARKLGSFDLRKRSSALINDDLLIDLNQDIMSSSFMHGISIDRIRYCLQTHSHSDHFDASHLITRIPEYASVNILPLDIYASELCLKNMSQMLKREWNTADLFNTNERRRMNLEIHIVESLQSFTARRYRITGFPSNHDKADGSLLYSIEENGYTVFYGTDTATLPEETWEGFHNKELRFDIVILDHTYGLNVGGNNHLNANQFIEHVKRMKDEKLLIGNARIFATHISHKGNPIHSELVEYAKNNGYEIAYDGLIIE